MVIDDDGIKIGSKSVKQRIAEIQAMQEAMYADAPQRAAKDSESIPGEQGMAAAVGQQVAGSEQVLHNVAMTEDVLELQKTTDKEVEELEDKGEFGGEDGEALSQQYKANAAPGPLERPVSSRRRRR